MLMFTHIPRDKEWCTLQRCMDENHLHVWDKNLTTSSSAWRMKVVHRMLEILFPATITMWGTSPLDHVGNDQSSPFLHFPTWATCPVLWPPFSYGKPPHFPMWAGEGLWGSLCQCGNLNKTHSWNKSVRFIKGKYTLLILT